jgi:hypothetical protein
MGQAMHSQCKTLASSERATAEADETANLPITGRRASLCLAGVAALALMALALSGRSAPTFVKDDLAGSATSQFLAEAASAPQIDGDLAEFQFGYVEFDWPPGKVPGFAPLPPNRRLAAAPTLP